MDTRHCFLGANWSNPLESFGPTCLCSHHHFGQPNVQECNGSMFCLQFFIIDYYMAQQWPMLDGQGCVGYPFLIDWFGHGHGQIMGKMVKLSKSKLALGNVIIPCKFVDHDIFLGGIIGNPIG